MEWKPIETAPKGNVLVAAVGGGVFQAYSFGGNPHYIQRGFYNNRVYDATHWMPLPEPPREEQK